MTVRRFDLPPDRIGALADSLGRLGARAPLHFVVGRIVAHPPPSSTPLTLPYGLDDALVTNGEATPAAVRVDLEERFYAFSRPVLERVERGREFYVSDGTGRALVQLSDDDGRLHPDVELHLDAPFRVHPVPPTEDDDRERTAYLRALRFGEQVAVVGHLGRGLDPLGGAGYRDGPELPLFSAELGALHLYDEAALRQLVAWHDLPWYRKLSVLVRNRT